MRVSEKGSLMTVIEVDICHRMGPLLFVYSITLTFIFKVKNFLVMQFSLKIMQSADIPGRFASTRTGSAVELLLFYFHPRIRTDEVATSN